MRDNPFANKKTVYYDVTDMDNIIKYEDSNREKQPFFGVPLLFIYKNEITGSSKEQTFRGNRDIYEKSA